MGLFVLGVILGSPTGHIPIQTKGQGALQLLPSQLESVQSPAWQLGEVGEKLDGPA